MNLYYVPHKKISREEYKHIKDTEHKIARLYQIVSFIVISVIGLFLCCN